jgi:HSP20 family protein
MNMKKWSPWNWFKNEEDGSKDLVPLKSEEGYGFPLSRLHQEVDKVFAEFFKDSYFPSLFDAGRKEGVSLLKPRVDIKEDTEHYTISVEVPGVSEKDVRIELVGDVLTIHGEKKQESEEKKGQYHRVERSYGAFQRTLTLPTDADKDKVHAKFKNGILSINIAKNPQAAGAAKRIEIQKD